MRLTVWYFKSKKDRSDPDTPAIKAVVDVASLGEAVQTVAQFEDWGFVVTMWTLETIGV